MGGVGPPVRGYVQVTRSRFLHSHLVALAIDGSTTSSATVSVADTVITDSPSSPFITGAEEYPECERWNDSQSWCKLDTRCRWLDDRRQCLPYVSAHGNTTAVFVYSRPSASAAPAIRAGEHTVVIRNLSVIVSGPRLNGLLDGRPLLSVDVLGEDVAALQGTVSVHVPHKNLCGTTLMSAKGRPESVAQLNVTCVFDGSSQKDADDGR